MLYKPWSHVTETIGSCEQILPVGIMDTPSEEFKTPKYQPEKAQMTFSARIFLDKYSQWVIIKSLINRAITHFLKIAHQIQTVFVYVIKMRRVKVCHGPDRVNLHLQSTVSVPLTPWCAPIEMKN